MNMMNNMIIKNELQINYYSVDNGTDFFNNVFCYSLNDEVEILEKKKEIPEKLNYKYRNMYGHISQHKQSEIDIINTLNEVIDYLDYLKSKGE